MIRMPLASASLLAIAIALAVTLLAIRFVMLSSSAMSAYASVATELGRGAQWTATIERIRTEPGPVACETLALCYWAGRNSEIEFFNFGQRVLLDPAFGDAFAQQIERGEIGLIQRELTGGAKRLPPDLEAIIDTHYRLETNSPTALYVPADR